MIESTLNIIGSDFLLFLAKLKAEELLIISQFRESILELRGVKGDVTGSEDEELELFVDFLRNKGLTPFAKRERER